MDMDAAPARANPSVMPHSRFLLIRTPPLNHSHFIISQKQEKRVRDNKKYGKLSANKVLRDFISWNKEAIDNTFS